MYLSTSNFVSIETKQMAELKQNNKVDDEIATSSTEDIIKLGDYVIVQRQNYKKIHKIKQFGSVTLGKDVIELDEIIGKKYYSTFRMIAKPRNKRVYILEETKFVQSLQESVNIDKSGIDNRTIIDDGLSQKLTTEEIHKLRDDALSSSDIVEKLITNSKTFTEKTEYSQQKYMKKKEKKYFEYIQIRKPNLRLIAEIYYRLDPGKIQGIRIDDLSQILTYANIEPDSNTILYDSGTSGLLTAAVLKAIGNNTKGTLIHMHPGNVCQKDAFLALNFPNEQKERCINVCLYSVLRCYYQEFKTLNESVDINKLESDAQINETAEEINENSEKNETNEDKVVGKKRKLSTDESEGKSAKRPCWQIENEKACKIIDNKVDSLIIVAKEHPTNIVQELLGFLNYGKPFVIYNLLREPLEELYFTLKNQASYIALTLSNNFLRYYQVLENRTHPDVTMARGGYILTGFKVDINE